MPSSAEPEIVHIPAELFGRLWEHLAPFLLLGLSAATDKTLEQVVAGVIAGDDDLWAVIQDGKVIGSFLTSSFEDPESNALFLGVYGLGGTRAETWARKLGDEMVDAAKQRGCGSVRFCGREAWSRVLPSYRAIGERENGHSVFERAVQ
jgi:hypothetical protein